MTPTLEIVAARIDAAPLNRGLVGADWLASEGNVPVTFGNGDVALFDNEGDGVFEGHYLFVSRGAEAIRHARQALRTMFAEHGATLIFGMVPDFRRDVKWITRRLGFKSAGLRETPEGPCELFVLSNVMFYRGAPQ